jgi:hypothetical protein
MLRSGAWHSPPRAAVAAGDHRRRITHERTATVESDKQKGVSSMMPKRTWWMKRHDTINFAILAVILIFIIWKAIFP